MDLSHVNLDTLKLHFPYLHPLHGSWFAVIRRQSASWFRGQSITVQMDGVGYKVLLDDPPGL